MIKIVVLSHSNLAKALVQSCDFIIADSDGMYSLCLDEKGIEEFGENLKVILNSVKGEKVLFMCDLRYGSPYNQLKLNLLEFEDRIEYEILTGVNLPMLIQAEMSKGETELKSVYDKCKKAGLEGIAV